MMHGGAAAARDAARPAGPLRGWRRPSSRPGRRCGSRPFRWLWLGVLISSVGTVMQTVGAQWLLVDAPNAATLVSLVGPGLRKLSPGAN
jgi:hypothetical protein